jgi:dTDP-N-acetylfucosamine:lipid II N-acetylfucosaminyltransferase
VKSGEILHIFNWDKKFFCPFRSFIRENFADGRHRFVVYGNTGADSTVASDDTTVYPARLLKKASKLSLEFAGAEKIMLHGLFHSHLYYILSLQPWLLKKCYWYIWGGDLYVHENGNRGLRFQKDELVRRFVISRLGHLVTYVPGDYELAKEWYGATGAYHECIMYPSNVYRNSAAPVPENGPMNIQVGNSADPENRHIEIFERLSPYRDEDIKIYVPLSYGDQTHAAEVIEAGTRMFGHRFIPMTDFMPYSQYCEFLRSLDIATFYHKRQQGMGNMIALLGMGKKVYMRSDVTSWRLFNNLNVAVFDVENLELTRLEQPVQRANEQKIATYFSEEQLRSQLTALFAS